MEQNLLRDLRWKIGKTVLKNIGLDFLWWLSNYLQSNKAFTVYVLCLGLTVKWTSIILLQKRQTTFEFRSNISWMKFSQECTALQCQRGKDDLKVPSIFGRPTTTMRRPPSLRAWTLKTTFLFYYFLTVMFNSQANGTTTVPLPDGKTSILTT
jgi:hypothetical protein